MLYVQEAIVSTLVEEGQFQEALPRLEKLAKTTQDRYRQSTLLMEAAELKVRLKNRRRRWPISKALLDQLNPENWLYRDVSSPHRGRVSAQRRFDGAREILRRLDGQASDRPRSDRTRLSRTLSTQGRVAEARSWLRKGIEGGAREKRVAPNLIDQLVYEQNYAEAAQEYEAAR